MAHRTPGDRVSDVALESVGGRAHSAAAAIYGTILITAVIAALSEDPAAGPGEMLSVALLTSTVFWLAHAYADGVGERVATTDRARWLSPMALLAHTWPMMQAALLVTVPLVLGALGILHRTAAVRGALLIGIVELCLWGYLAGRHIGPGRLVRVESAVFISLLGVAIALLKLLVH